MLWPKAPPLLYVPAVVWHQHADSVRRWRRAKGGKSPRQARQAYADALAGGWLERWRRELPGIYGAVGPHGVG
jgi:hypothetical protein